MTNPRKHTCKLLEMVDSGILSAADALNAALSYMSDDDVEDMMHMNQWDDMEENDTEEEAEITIGDTVTVYGVEYVATQSPEPWDCARCAGNHNHLCRKLPDCGGLIFVRKAG